MHAQKVKKKYLAIFDEEALFLVIHKVLNRYKFSLYLLRMQL